MPFVCLVPVRLLLSSTTALYHVNSFNPGQNYLRTFLPYNVHYPTQMKTISKTTAFQNEIPFPQFNNASYKRPGTRLSFEHTTTLLPRGGEKGTICESYDV